MYWSPKSVIERILNIFNVEKLDKLYQEKINSAIIRSRSDWYEYGEKLPKFFLNLEKNRAVQSQVRTIFYSEKELMKNV